MGRSDADNDRVHAAMARRGDKPTAALLKDLKARGLLDQTLIIWGGEFERIPITVALSRQARRVRSQSLWLHDLAGGLL